MLRSRGSSTVHEVRIDSELVRASKLVEHEGRAPLPMSDDPRDEPFTELLQRMQDGDSEAGERVFSVVYSELRAQARRMMGGGEGDTLQPTAVVNEAWIKLAAGQGADWQSRDHFLGFAARAMRSILVDYARAKKAAKRGGRAERVELDEALRAYEERAIDLLALDEALERLSGADPVLARLVELRFFGGLTIAETARVLEVSTPTVERGWRAARSWLRSELDGDEDL